MTCALPPLDMRFARGVAKDRTGMDFVQWADAGARMVSAPVVSVLPGTVYEVPSGLLRMHYRAPVVVSTAAGFLVYSGLRPETRARAGARVARGDVIGHTDPANPRFSPAAAASMRRFDRTSGVDPVYPYLHFEVWSSLPRVREYVTIRGPEFHPINVNDNLNPVAWWRAQGLVVSGPTNSWALEIVAGGPSDPEVCS